MSVFNTIRSALGSAQRSLHSWAGGNLLAKHNRDKAQLINAQDKRERKNALRLKHRVQ